MRVLGISALSHDASITVIEDGEIAFAAHAERYSRLKNDAELNQPLIDAALAAGTPDTIAWYERPVLKKTRQLLAGQWASAVSLADLPRRYLRRFGLHKFPLRYVPHHESHAAAGFLTSPFDHAAVLVVDAIGEWGTISIGEYRGRSLRWLGHSVYPHSLGLLYSAFAQRCGLKPNEEEYILMGMAAFGAPRYATDIRATFIECQDFGQSFRLKTNVHRGIENWRPEARREDLAASIQQVTEEVLLEAVRWIASNTAAKNLVLMGGVALNCVANERLARFWGRHTASREAIWTMPNPGDGGNSLGAAATVWGDKVKWRGPYLGTRIAGRLDLEAALDALLRGDIIGIANGRAEFGPRALGNRSLVCDPRGKNTKDRVNAIKKRDPFRPFAPMVLAEHAERYFDMPVARSPYMQFTAPCKEPGRFPAICHVDGSSRVQTLTAQDNPTIHALLSGFFERTGCPMLLNTSLNIKGEPLVDTWDDATRFAAAAGVAVY